MAMTDATESMDAKSSFVDETGVKIEQETSVEEEPPMATTVAVANENNSVLSHLSFRSGDVNGFAQLFFDNVATLLVLISKLELIFFILGPTSENVFWLADNGFIDQLTQIEDMSNDIIYRRIVPGLAITMIFGNLYYSYMAVRLARKENRKFDVTALPYGVNTPAAFAFVFSIMLPVLIGSQYVPGEDGQSCADIAASNLRADASGEEVQEFANCYMQAMEKSWAVGVVGNFLTGLISVALSFGGDLIQKITPAQSLLTSLAGIGFIFLGIAQFAFAMAQPINGFLPAFLSFACYFGDVKTWIMPVSLVIILVGTILGWSAGVLDSDMEGPISNVKPWGMSGGFSALGDWSDIGTYIGIVLPVAITAAVSTIMNVHSAKKAGDEYGVKEAMVADGLGTVVAALFGCPFGTTVYIGHPAYKKMGARVGYSLVNAVVFSIFAFFGLFALCLALLPVPAIAPVILFVGLAICKDALEIVPAKHFPAYMIGLMPVVADWAITGGLTVSNLDYNTYGYRALQKGSLLVSLVLTTLVIHLTDRSYLEGAAWCFGASLLALFGLMHQDQASVDFNVVSAGYCHSVMGIEEYTEETCATSNALLTNCTQENQSPGCGPTTTYAWQFMVGYLQVGALCLILHACQKLPSTNPFSVPQVSKDIREGEAEFEPRRESNVQSF